MTPLLHNYSNKAGRIYNWDVSDTQENWAKNMQVPELNKKLTELGFVDRPVTYTFNNHGFRTHEFDQQFDILCFGCSFTMGTGVYQEQTWPAQLENITGLRAANLGHAGSSNDTVFRFAQHYLPVMRPRYAVWLQTDMHRIELLDDTNKIAYNILASDQKNPCANDFFMKTWFVNQSNQQLNWQKNTLAFKALCNDLDIKTVILSRDQVPAHGLFPFSHARDLTHPGAESYAGLAKRMADMISHA